MGCRIVRAALKRDPDPPRASTSIDKRSPILEDSRPARAGRIEFAAIGSLSFDSRDAMYENFLRCLSDDFLYSHEVLVDHPFDSCH